MFRTGARPFAIVASVAGLAGFALLSVVFAQSAWDSVVRFRSPMRFVAGQEIAGAPLAERAVLVVVDGLRVDMSRRMPFLNELRARGVDMVARVGTPSYSRPGRATLAMGAWPETHGVTTNRQRRPAELDSIFASVARSQRTCRVSGSPIWPSLFGEAIGRCGDVWRLKTKEGPGQFRSLRASIEASEESGLQFALAEPANLLVVDFLATDAAAHDWGALGEDYANEASRIDRLVRRLAEGVGIDRAAFVVTADHGHRDAGGHGSDEKEVLEVPLILAGLGIRAGLAGDAELADVAPTLAALLGTALPGSAHGRVLTEALDVDARRRAEIDSASERQRAAFTRGYVAALRGDETNVDARAIHAARSAAVAGERRRRLPAALGLVVGFAALLAWAVRGRRGAIIVGAAVYALSFTALVVGFRQPLTLSAINYDDQITAFFRPFLLYAFAAFAVGTAAAIRWARRTSAHERWTVVLRLAAGVGAALGIFGAIAYAREGLFSTWRVPPIPVLFAVFLAGLQAAGIAIGALLIGGVQGVLAIGRARTAAISEAQGLEPSGTD